MATEELKTYQDLLDKFKKVPIQERKRTFMEICQYPYSRFEEICSRILAYYFDPKGEHGFRYLWFSAFMQCLDNTDNDNPPRDINIQLEEPTYCADEYKKRIDLIIETESTIYAIENKIGASLYNKLDMYSQHIENKKEYKEKRKVYAVLTAHTLSPDEINKANTYKFKTVYYKDLFEKVMAMLGDYVARNNNNQLTFMLDFMDTLNNKMNFMVNKERADFFSKNKDKVEALINEYNQWRVEMRTEQENAISPICDRIRKATTNSTWWLYQDWDLGTVFNEGTNERIGIESNFEANGSDALAKFRIYITTWQGRKASPIQCWLPYKEAVMKQYANCHLDEGVENESKRVYFHLPEIDGHDTDAIIKALKECYDFLKGLVDERVKNNQINK